LIVLGFVSGGCQQFHSDISTLQAASESGGGDNGLSFAPLGRALSVAEFYTVSGRYGNFLSEAPNNTIMIGACDYGNAACDESSIDWNSYQRDLDQALLSGKPLIISSLTNGEVSRLRAHWGQVLAVFGSDELSVSDTTAVANSIRSRIAGLGLSRKPIVSNILATRLFQEGIPDVDWLGLEAYIGPQSPATVEDAIEQLQSVIDSMMAVVPMTQKVSLIAMSYDRNGQWTDLNTLAAIQPVYLDAARKYSNIVSLLAFSYGRPGGMASHRNELAPIWSAITRAVQTPQPL
jgi:hypothetical protein